MPSSGASAPLATAASADATLRTLWEWLASQGASHNRLWPDDCPTTGRGMRLTSGLVAKGSVLLRIPPAALFSSKTHQATPLLVPDRSILSRLLVVPASGLLTDPSLGPLLSAAVAASIRVGPLATLCFGLLHARSLGEQSRWCRLPGRSIRHSKPSNLSPVFGSIDDMQIPRSRYLFLRSFPEEMACAAQ
jgi:hypothetical protein